MPDLVGTGLTRTSDENRIFRNNLSFAISLGACCGVHRFGSAFFGSRNRSPDATQNRWRASLYRSSFSLKWKNWSEADIALILRPTIGKNRFVMRNTTISLSKNQHKCDPIRCQWTDNDIEGSFFCIKSPRIFKRIQRLAQIVYHFVFVRRRMRPNKTPASSLPASQKPHHRKNINEHTEAQRITCASGLCAKSPFIMHRNGWWMNFAFTFDMCFATFGPI